MSYRKSWTDLSDLPTRCPLCVDKRVDAQAVKVHNELVARTGERSYRWR